MLKALTATRCLALLGLLSCILFFTLVPRYDLLESNHATALARRGLFDLGDDATSSAATSASASSTQPSATSATSASTSAPATSAATSAAATSAAAPTSTSTTPTSTPSSTQSSTQSSSASSSAAATSNPVNTQPSSTPAAATSAPSTQAPQKTAEPVTSLVQSVSTNAQGEDVTLTYTVTSTPSLTASASSSASASADQSNDSSSSGVGTSTIIGLSVAGGVALIGIAAFLFWKFSRKRFSDDEFDDGEAIKWPELNQHTENPHALPTNRAGPAGFETNSEINLTRPDSRAGSFATTAATSAADLYVPEQDPYAVPPFPHVNPNQPYRDDPRAYYDDPYGTPAPGEAIPMTQIGRRSPGPQATFAPPYVEGRNSPAPRVLSPNGRMSPGPQMGYGRAPSPGPQMVYGRASPGPQVAYGAPR